MNQCAGNAGGEQRVDLRRNPPLIMNAKEVATYLGVSPRKVRGDAAAGLMPCVKLGGRVLFRLKDVNARLDRLTNDD
ncbi:MAG: helix-turn-helix domain-containing protein [Verrucomicrobia bacterium]|jgi:excisionase family DNA binding protein|nr:helix-turn-helix domain-containing protein [Verrucomicrobiota bacterium]MDA1045942.1 helix-turn-helix domain-containing protein [Verrucomicrobiota bacterium]